jgi:hypothetical protein
MNARTVATTVAVLMLAAAPAPGQLPRGQVWVTTWAGSVHGPYPAGNPVAQPMLDRVFDAQRGATDQTFRLIVRPTVWGPLVRLRFANTFGTRPVALDDLFVGLQATGGAIAPGTNQKVAFSGKTAVTVPAGQSIFSDPVGKRC